MKTISSDDLKAFLNEACRSGVYEMYYIVLATGLRRGELLGLKWEDVDFKNGTIRIKRQVARIEGKLVEAPLKTKNSYRTISISEDAVEVLQRQKAKSTTITSSPVPPAAHWHQTASEECSTEY